MGCRVSRLTLQSRMTLPYGFMKSIVSGHDVVLRVAILMALNTGLRLGVVLALCWRDIDKSIEMTLRYSHPGASERRKAVALLSGGHLLDTTSGFVVSFDSFKSLKIKSVRL